MRYYYIIFRDQKKSELTNLNTSTEDINSTHLQSPKWNPAKTQYNVDTVRKRTNPNKVYKSI